MLLMKKVQSLLLIIFVLILGFIFFYPSKSSHPALFNSSNQRLISILSNRYAQLNEYSDDLNAALKAQTNAQKFNRAILAMSKIILVNDSLQYLQAGLDNGDEVDLSLLIARLGGMSSHTKDFLEKLGDKRSLTPEEEKALQKDVKDAKYIFQTLNYQWISQGNYEEIKQAIVKLNQFLSK